MDGPATPWQKISDREQPWITEFYQGGRYVETSKSPEIRWRLLNRLSKLIKFIIHVGLKVIEKYRETELTLL